MSRATVVHLVWAPLGLAPVRRFVRAYGTVAAGREHDLLVVLNGFGAADEAALAATEAELAGVAHASLRLPEPVQDLAAYRLAAERLDGASALCFLNSHSEPLADGWLALLQEQLERPGVGIVGATGSHESVFSDTPLPLKPLRWREYPPFPNPHLRTNAFMLDRATLLALDWRVDQRKSSAHRLESGTKGITRQVLAGGEEALVVGRDGRGYAPREWPGSRTYRSGAQENLLVADNRTRMFAEADPRERARLARMAWGDRAAEAID